MLSIHLILEARSRARLTQAELARRAGTTQSAVARWERGGSQPTVETLRRLLSACGFDLAVRLAPVDAEASAQLDRHLALTPVERFDQLVTAARFVQAGREALAQGR